MNVIEVMRLPVDVDLSGFVAMLRRLELPHRVIEDGAEQVLWAPPGLAGQVLELYQRFPQGSPDVQRIVEPAPQQQVPEADAPVVPSLKEQALACKACIGVLLLTLLVVAVTGMGENYSTVSWFSFMEFQRHGDYLYFTSLAKTLGEGQWWRLFSPMLLHFSLMQLAFNAVLFWELGKRIELRQGAWALLNLTLLCSLVSNLAQHFTSGPGIFGGLSGVVYGLLGYVAVYQRLAPNPHYGMPKGFVVVALVWLVAGVSGVISQLGFGQIANAAHVGGLLIGCLAGLLGGALARRKLSA
ncbi:MULTISPECIES: rhomboid family intramembrane serine protease [unclassified Pseudomonas]|uniref:rhomboid family intramembrane serine protease n=1 Tax=unclassified Pseudomonas TaxID=196821 RepID=UPI0035C170A8